MQNRSFQAYPITLYSNFAQYKVNWNPNVSMWELRSAKGRRLEAARDIWIIAEHIKTRDTLIIPKGTDGIGFLPDNIFKQIEEYSLIIRTHMLIGATDFSHIDIPEAVCYTHKLSREQLMHLGFIQTGHSKTVPAWWFMQCDLIVPRFYDYLYAEKPFT